MLAVHHVEYKIAARNGYHAGYHGQPMQDVEQWPEALRMVWLNNWDWGRQQRYEDQRGDVLILVMKPDEPPRSWLDRVCDWFCGGK